MKTEKRTRWLYKTTKELIEDYEGGIASEVDGDTYHLERYREFTDDELGKDNY